MALSPLPAAVRESHVHYFRLTAPADITPELRSLMRQAYAVGGQRHLDHP